MSAELRLSINAVAQLLSDPDPELDIKAFLKPDARVALANILRAIPNQQWLEQVFVLLEGMVNLMERSGEQNQHEPIAIPQPMAKAIAEKFRYLLHTMDAPLGTPVEAPPA